jgi:probable phosphoglycerate mutase
LPLNAAGSMAARSLALELGRAVQPGIQVVSSPLRRARQTAEAIVEVIPGSSIRIDERWAEADFGVAEGLTYDELLRIAPAVAERLVAGAFAIDWPGGEPAAALAARVVAALRDVVDGPTPAVVVSHGGPLRIAIGIATGRDPADVVAPDPGTAWRMPARRPVEPVLVRGQ